MRKEAVKLWYKRLSVRICTCWDGGGGLRRETTGGGREGKKSKGERVKDEETERGGERRTGLGGKTSEFVHRSLWAESVCGLWAGG